MDYNKKAKLIMIGLDGGTFKIIDPLIEEGKLPNFKHLIENGTKATLKSTIPPLTAPAWVTLMTGVNPGKHGLFDFRKMGEITYDMPYNPQPTETCALMHSQYYAGKTIWDLIGKTGLKMSVIMMPMTYPPWPINGYMLSGYPSPDFKNPSGYPKEWASSLGSLFDMPFILRNNEDILIRECQKLVKRCEEIIIKQLEENECDIYSIVFSSTDFLQHYLWKYHLNGKSKYNNAIRDIYIEIDKSVGRILELVDRNQCSVAVLSDHGFMASPEKYFNTNAWLVKEGYLVVREKSLRNKIFSYFLKPFKYQKVSIKLRVFIKSYFKYLPKILRKKLAGSYYSTNQFNWPASKAFRYKVGMAEGIAINLKGRQPAGVVGPEEYENLRSEIIKKLSEFRDTDTGEKVISEIYKREEAYQGKFVDLLPDIVFMLGSQHKGGVGIDKNGIIEPALELSESAISGNHDMNGILILSGPKFKKNSNITPVKMVDIFPTVLYDLGIPIPSYSDGRVIKEALNDEFSSVPPKYREGESYEAVKSSDISSGEEEQMKKALRGLGYIN